MPTLIDEMIRLLTPVDGQLPPLTNHELTRLHGLTCGPVDTEKVHRLLQAIEETLLQLDVGRVRMLISRFGRQVSLGDPWPHNIAPSIMGSIGQAFHTLKRPNVALALSEYFCFDTETWPNIEAEMVRLGLPPVDIKLEEPCSA